MSCAVGWIGMHVNCRRLLTDSHTFSNRQKDLHICLIIFVVFFRLSTEAPICDGVETNTRTNKRRGFLSLTISTGSYLPAFEHIELRDFTIIKMIQII